MKCTVAAWVSCQATGTATGWGITGGNLKEGLWLSSMKDEPGSTIFPYQVKTDRGPLSWRFLDDEIIHAKEELEIIFDVASGNHPHAAIHSFSYPNSVSDATVFEYFSNVIPGVFKGARISDNGSAYLSNANIYNSLGIPAFAFRGSVNSGTNAFEPAVRAAARNIYGWSQMKGGILIPYIHGTGDLTVQQTQWIIDELTRLGVEFVTTSEMMDWIKSKTTNFTNDGCTGVGTLYTCCTGPDSYCTNSQYTQTFTQSNFQITPSSPVVWKGTSHALVTTDILGNTFHTPPSIGPFELAINGVCDPTYNGTIQYSLTSGYCLAGTVSAATSGICPCTWQCVGSGVGTTASCATAQDKTGPALILTTLTDGSITASPTLTISGTLSDPSGIAGLTINNGAVTVTGSSFSYPVQLQTGSNVITTIATDRVGNRTTDTRTITRISALSNPTISDALKVLRSAIGLISLTAEEQIYFDVAPLDGNGKPQGDGIVDLGDAVVILEKSIDLMAW
jgi:hypothetical protein